MTSEESKSDRKRNSGRVVIWVAVIGLVGTLGAALISNWNTYSPPETVSSTEEPKVSSVNRKVEVEKLASKWCAAWLSGDADTFVSLASEPFFFDHNLALTKSELRSNYLNLKKEKGDVWADLKIISIKVQTAGELKNQGYDLSKDRIFRSMNLTLDDYAVTVTIEFKGRKEAMLLVVRRLEDSYEIVGTWD